MNERWLINNSRVFSNVSIVPNRNIKRRRDSLITLGPSKMNGERERGSKEVVKNVVRKKTNQLSDPDSDLPTR